MCGTGAVRKISVPSAQLCCEPKMALKNKVYQKKKVCNDTTNLAY